MLDLFLKKHFRKKYEDNISEYMADKIVRYTASMNMNTAFWMTDVTVFLIFLCSIGMFCFYQENYVYMVLTIPFGLLCWGLSELIFNMKKVNNTFKDFVKKLYECETAKELIRFTRYNDRTILLKFHSQTSVDKFIKEFKDSYIDPEMYMYIYYDAPIEALYYDMLEHKQRRNIFLSNGRLFYAQADDIDYHYIFDVTMYNDYIVDLI